MKLLIKSVASLTLLSGLLVAGNAKAATPLTSILLKSTAVQLKPTGAQVSPTLTTIPMPSSKIVPTATKPPGGAPEGCGPRP